MINLKAKRKEAGMTQQELANKVGVVRTHISNIEIGIINPSVPVAMAIGKILGFDWVLFFEDRKRA